jgi:hypothetical protein
VLGLVGCVTLTLALPIEALIGGAISLAAGVLARAITRRKNG